MLYQPEGSLRTALAPLPVGMIDFIIARSNGTLPRANLR